LDYTLAIRNIRMAEDLGNSIQFLKAYALKHPELQTNCYAWIRTGHRNKERLNDSILLKKLHKENKHIIRLEHAHSDLIRCCKNIYKQIIPGTDILYENYSLPHYDSRATIDLVLTDNRYIYCLNASPYLRRADFIGSFLGTVKSLEEKFSIHYPVYYLAPRFTLQAQRALSLVEYIYPLWFEYFKEKGRLVLHSLNENKHPHYFSPSKTYLNPFK